MTTVPDGGITEGATTSVRRVLNEEATLTRRGYTLGVLIGEGSYATVYSCADDRRKQKCAIKIVNRRKAASDFIRKFLPREISIIKKLKHPNIVEVYDLFEFGGKVYIVMELAGHGDLLDYIKLRRFLTEEKAREFFRQLLDGVAYLHQNSIVHRDLKCENILLNNQNVLKITDFGFAREMATTDLSRTFCGSAAYAAPEVLQGKSYKGVFYDVWSLGVILYIMVCGSMPFDDTNIKRMIKDQQDQRLTFTKKKQVSTDFRNLIFAILYPEPQERASLAAIFSSDWLSLNGSNVAENIDRNKERFPKFLPLSNAQTPSDNSSTGNSLQPNSNYPSASCTDDSGQPGTSTTPVNRRRPAENNGCSEHERREKKFKS